MSENGQTNPSGSHSQSRTVSTGEGGDPEVGTVQSETIQRLDKIITEYSNQRVALHDVSQSIRTTLADNPALTDTQHTQSFKLYEGRLEQAVAARVQAIARGERLQPKRDPNGDPAPEDGPRQPNPDGEVRAPIEVSAQSNPDYLFTGAVQGSSTKQTGEDERVDRGLYTWNWDKPGGGRPWKNVDRDLLSMSDKTHLRNAYAANIKQAVRDLEAQRKILDFPPTLWRDILANCHIDFGTLLEDRFSRTTTYDEKIDIGDEAELTTKKSGKPKVKISNHPQWMYAWSKYRKAVTYTFPHRSDKLGTYEDHIIGLFNSDLNPLHCIEYDQAARKYLHGNHIDFSQVDRLATIGQQIFYPRTGGGGISRIEGRNSGSSNFMS